MRKVMLTMVLCMAGCSGVLAGDLGMSNFIGLWEVDFDRTMEEGKKSPKYDDKMAERMPAMIQRMMKKMTIKFTDKEMIYFMGTNEVTFPYSIKSSDSTSVTVSMKQGSNEATVVFTLIRGKYMNFKSSASDDMDYYVWKKGTKKKVEENK